MSWIDGIVDTTEPLAFEREPHADGIRERSQARSWDPLEVWLTRVKQPRDRAAQRTAAQPVPGAPGRQA